MGDYNVKRDHEFRVEVGVTYLLSCHYIHKHDNTETDQFCESETEVVEAPKLKSVSFSTLMRRETNALGFQTFHFNQLEKQFLYPFRILVSTIFRILSV